MPALSPTMTEGNVAEWRKKEGDKIAPGDVLAEIETDKAIGLFEATEPGFLAKILVGNGTENVQVGVPIAVVVDTAGEIAAAATAPPKGAPPSASNYKPTSGRSPSVAHTVLGLPALSPTMSEGAIVAWKKTVGAKIKRGDALAEIETDKAIITFDAPEDGFLAKIIVPAGSPKISLNSPIAIIVGTASDISAVANFQPARVGRFRP